MSENDNSIDRPEAHQPAFGVNADPSVEFDSVYKREFASLVRASHAICGSASIAEEVVHDAFLAAHNRWDHVRTLDNPAAWIRRVVINRSISVIRRVNYEARAILRLSNRPPADQSLEATHSLTAGVIGDSDDELWSAVRKLPKRQRQAIVLRYVNDMGTAEIAEVLECEPATARIHLSRGRKRLAQILGEEPGPEDCPEPEPLLSVVITSPQHEQESA